MGVSMPRLGGSPLLSPRGCGVCPGVSRYVRACPRGGTAQRGRAPASAPGVSGSDAGAISTQAPTRRREARARGVQLLTERMPPPPPCTRTPARAP